jgi:hypothetical protein
MQKLDGDTLQEPLTSLTKIDRAVAASTKLLNQAEGPEVGWKESVQVILRRHEQPSQRFSEFLLEP